MQFLAEEIGFEAEQDFGTFNLTEPEALGSHFFRVGHDWVDVGSHVVSEGLGS